MKKIILASLLAVSVASPAYASHPMCGKTELADVMGGMKDKMKAIKKAVKTGDMGQVTTIAKDLLAQVEESENHVPLAISDKPELNEKQQAQMADYKKGLKMLKKAVTELVKADNLVAIKSALGDIGKASKKGHKAFKMDCDD